MAVFKLCLAFVLLALWSASSDAALCCKSIKDHTPNATSGKYIFTSLKGIPYKAYCEMGLNGGGYTFLPPRALSYLTNEDILPMSTNITSLLLRVRKTDGTQRYAVLNQLSEFANVPLMVGINNYTGYNPPKNEEIIGEPYLYFGFLPISAASGNNKVLGLEVNGKRVTFTNCGTNSATVQGQITLFPNYREVEPSKYHAAGSVCDGIFSNLKLNPSGRVMPLGFFHFGETWWKGDKCECFTDTNQMFTNRNEILSLSIGFR